MYVCVCVSGVCAVSVSGVYMLCSCLSVCLSVCLCQGVRVCTCLLPCAHTFITDPQPGYTSDQQRLCQCRGDSRHTEASGQKKINFNAENWWSVHSTPAHPKPSLSGNSLWMDQSSPMTEHSAAVCGNMTGDPSCDLQEKKNLNRMHHAESLRA